LSLSLKNNKKQLNYCIYFLASICNINCDLVCNNETAKWETIYFYKSKAKMFMANKKNIIKELISVKAKFLLDIFK